VLDTVGWVIRPVKIVPDMTYNVFGGTLNPTLLLLHVTDSDSRIATYKLSSLGNGDEHPTCVSTGNLPLLLTYLVLRRLCFCVSLFVGLSVTRITNKSWSIYVVNRQR